MRSARLTALGRGGQTERIVVTGATGNVGTAVVATLAEEPRVDTIVGVARRLPAWLFQPTQDPVVTWNVRSLAGPRASQR